MSQFREEEFASSKFNSNLWIRLFKMIFKHKKKLVIASGSMILMVLMDIIFILMYKEAIDSYLTGAVDASVLVRFIVIFVGIIIVSVLGVYFFIAKGGEVEMDFSYEIRKQVMEKLQQLSFSFYDTTNSGWILTRVTSDITRLSEVLAWTIIDFSWGFSMFVFSLVMMFYTNAFLTLIVLIMIPFVLLVSFYFQKKILANYRETRKINSLITAGFSEGILGAKTSKTMAVEAYHESQFDETISKMRQRSIKAAYTSGLFHPIVNFSASIAMALLLGQGGSMVLNGVFTIGTLTAFTQFARQFYDPLQQFAGMFSELQMAQAAGERVLSLLDRDVEIVDSEAVLARYGTILEPKPENYEPMQGKVRFEHVEFYYNEKEPVLKNFSLSVEPGQTIALVGETGSGKSTIVNLLCRFYEPVKGCICIDDKDVRERSIGWLHSNLGYVLQAPHLFSGSVAENIRFGKLSATNEEIIEVAKLVGAHEFIMELEGQYDFDVGEGGSRLSTGQKQLLSFARALIADPALLVLDEATSSIDTQTEAAIQKAIATILEGRTSFIVAHRLSTIVNADRILVIEQGEIVEQGSHRQLIEQKGQYYQLYLNQFTQKQEDQYIERRKLQYEP